MIETKTMKKSKMPPVRSDPHAELDKEDDHENVLHDIHPNRCFRCRPVRLGVHLMLYIDAQDDGIEDDPEPGIGPSRKSGSSPG